METASSKSVLNETQELAARIERSLPGEAIIVVDPDAHARSILREESTTFWNKIAQQSQRPLDNLLRFSPKEPTVPGKLEALASVVENGSAVVQGISCLISPGMRVAHHLNGETLPSMGNQGLARFAAYHEMGHVIDMRTGMMERNRTDERYAAYRNECRADAFVVAMAVAQGSNAKQVVQEVQELRAYGYQKDLQPTWATMRVLPGAALIGNKNRGDVDPVEIFMQSAYAVDRSMMSPEAFKALENRAQKGKIDPTASIEERYASRASAPKVDDLTSPETLAWHRRSIQQNPECKDLIPRLATAALYDLIEGERMPVKNRLSQTLGAIEYGLSIDDPNKIKPTIRAMKLEFKERPSIAPIVVERLKTHCTDPLDHWIQTKVQTFAKRCERAHKKPQGITRD